MIRATLALVLFGACAVEHGASPDPVDPPPAKSAAEKAFDAVYPTLVAKCGGCHGAGDVASGAPATSGFVDPSAETAYATIKQFPIFDLFRIDATHPSDILSSADRAAIETWLDAELAGN